MMPAAQFSDFVWNDVPQIQVGGLILGAGIISLLLFRKYLNLRGWLLEQIRDLQLEVHGTSWDTDIDHLFRELVALRARVEKLEAKRPDRGTRTEPLSLDRPATDDSQIVVGSPS